MLKYPPASIGDMRHVLDPESEDSLEEEMTNPLQYPCLESHGQEEHSIAVIGLQKSNTTEEIEHASYFKGTVKMTLFPSSLLSALFRFIRWLGSGQRHFWNWIRDS